jgi:hypothetical protein
MRITLQFLSIPIMLFSTIGICQPKADDIAVPNPCIAKAEEMFLQRYELSSVSETPLYLKNAISRWETLVEQYTSAFVIRGTNDTNFISASIAPVGCSEEEDRYLVVIGDRLSFLIWRATMLSASYWEQGDPGELVERADVGQWPQPEVTNDLANAVLAYLGGGNLNTVNFSEFNQIIMKSEFLPVLMATHVVDMAELFMFFHESQHVLDLPGLRIDPKSLIPTSLSIADERRRQWEQELMADAQAAYLLVLAAGSRFVEKSGNLVEGRTDGFKIALSGVDTTLHILSLLERIRFGELSVHEAARHPSFTQHPPAKFRRNISSQLMQSLAVQVAGQTQWELIQETVGSYATVRQMLFDHLLSTRPDVISMVR